MTVQDLVPRYRLGFIEEELEEHGRYGSTADSILYSLVQNGNDYLNSSVQQLHRKI